MLLRSVLLLTGIAVIYGQPYGISSTEDDLGLSFAESSTDPYSGAPTDSSVDEIGLSCSESSSSEDGTFHHTGSSAAQPPNLHTVNALVPPPNDLNSFFLTEVKINQKMKKKACSLLSVKSALKMSCKCSKDCLKQFSFRIIRTIRNEFWTNPKPVRIFSLQRIVQKSTKCGQFRYLQLPGNGLHVCTKAFCSILNVNKNVLSIATGLSSENKKTVPSKKPRDMSDNSLLLINWLKDYATFRGDRMPNSKDILLPYRTKKTDVFTFYKTESGSSSPVSRSQFFKVWDKYFPHLKIKKTNSFSKCTMCTMLERQMEKTMEIEARAEIKQLRHDHNQRQMLERTYYYGKREASRKNPSQYLSMIIDGMDQSKTNLPHFTGRRPKVLNVVDLLKTHVTGVISHGHGGFYTFLDINEYAHDPNLTINVLLKMLKKTADRSKNRLPPVCYIQADNCWRENKNRFVLAFCEYLVTERIFNEVHLSFLYVGHTHEDVDAAFSHISEQLRVNDAATTEDLLKLLPQSEELNHLYDVKEWLEPAINNVQYQTQPLHYKFERHDDSVKIYFKGQFFEEWIVLNTNLMNSKPKGQPTILSPDYSKLDVPSIRKNIEKCKELFINSESLSKWHKYLDVIEKGPCVKRPPSKWILQTLPKQERRSGNTKFALPEDIQQLIEKEVRIPNLKVTVRKQQTAKKSLNAGPSKTTATSRKESKTKGSAKKSGGKRRAHLLKQQCLTKACIIPLSNEVKKHIWLMILYDMIDSLIYVLHLLITLILNYMFCVFAVLFNLYQLRLQMVELHIGNFAKYNQNCIPSQFLVAC